MAALIGLGTALAASALVLTTLIEPFGAMQAPTIDLGGLPTIHSLKEQARYTLAEDPTLKGRVRSEAPPSDLSLELRALKDLDFVPKEIDQNGAFNLGLSECTQILAANGPYASRTVQRVWLLPTCFDWLKGLDLEKADRSLHLALRSHMALARYSLLLEADQPGTDGLVAALLNRSLDLTLFLKLFFYDELPDSAEKNCSPQEFPLGFTGEELASISAPTLALDSEWQIIELEAVIEGWRYDYCYTSNVLSTSPGVRVVLDVEAISLQDFEPTPTIWLRHAQLGVLEDAEPPLGEGTQQRIVWEAGDRDEPFILVMFPSGQSETSANPHSRLLAVLEALRRAPLREWFALVILILGPIPVLAATALALARRNGESQPAWQQRRIPLLLLAYLWLIPLVFTWFYSEPAEGLESIWFWAATMAYCATLWLIWAVLARSRRPAAPWWVLVLVLPAAAGLLAPFFSLGANALVAGALRFALMGTLMLATALRLGLELLDPTRNLNLKTSWWSLGLLAFFLLALPTPLAAETFEPDLGWTLNDWGQFFVVSGVYLLPYAVLAGLVGILWDQREAAIHRDSSVWRAGSVIFAFFLVGLNRGLSPGLVGGLNVIPIAFLLAWIVYPYFLTKPQAKLGEEAAKLEGLRTEERDPVHEALSFRRAQRQPKQYFEELRTSKEDYEEVRKVLKRGMPDELFLSGPRPTRWQNGMLGLSRGLWLSALLVAVYAPAILAEAARNIVTPFYFLYVLAAFILPLFVKWVLYAFFFGYFYPHIRGGSGLAKGLWLALSLALCTVPHDLFANPSAAGLSAVLVDGGQTLLYLVILGIWAFDYEHLRVNGLNLRQLLLLYGALPLAGLGSAILGSAGSAISLVLEGRFVSILLTVLELISSPQSRLP